MGPIVLQSRYVTKAIVTCRADSRLRLLISASRTNSQYYDPLINVYLPRRSASNMNSSLTMKNKTIGIPDVPIADLFVEITNASLAYCVNPSVENVMLSADYI